MSTFSSESWFELRPNFERIVPASGRDRGPIRRNFEARDSIFVTVEHGDAVTL